VKSIDNSINRIYKQGFHIGLIVICLLLQFPPRLLAQNSSSDRVSLTEKEQGCQANLSQKIVAIINRPQWAKSHWGIAIETIHTKRILYQLNSDRYFIPASNTKLLSSAAVLSNLGADFRVETSFYANGNAPNLSSLRVLGRGDPTLTLASLKTVSQQLKERGIKKIEELIIDASYFSNPTINDSWEWGDVYFDYGVSPHSLILEENTVNLTITPQEIGKPVKLAWSDKIAGKQWKIQNYAKTVEKGKPYTVSLEANSGNSVLEIRGELPVDNEPDIWGLAIPDPSRYFVTSWRRILGEAGIEVDRTKIIKNSTQIDRIETKIAQLQSPPLAELLKKVNADSNNLVAETLLSIAAKEKQQDKLLIIDRVLTELGVDRSGYLLNDGSGLSRQNLITPKTLITILRSLSDNKIYHQSLAVSGTSGTLKNRFVDTSLQGLVFAKTGTLKGIASLSGYLEIPDREPIVFSIISNNYNAKAPEIRATIDEILTIVSENVPCSSS
jgi:serine-type D-Ala-D-Ala carboxypeptidase/endopeptidase (penicillin-binding protein 4)